MATVDGHSLMPLLHPKAGGGVTWPTVALIEHHGPSDVSDPDFENGELGGNPSAYEAIRISNRQFGNAVYVEYQKTRKREYYNIDKDPYERDNTYKLLSAVRRARLHRTPCRARAVPQRRRVLGGCRPSSGIVGSRTFHASFWHARLASLRRRSRPRGHGGPTGLCPSAKCPPDGSTMPVIAVTHTAASVAGIIGAIIVFGDRLAC